MRSQKNTRDKPISENQKAQIAEIVRAEIQAVMQMGTLPKAQVELPPSPGEKVKGEKGHKVSPGSRIKLSVMVDTGILKAFEAERKRRRISASELANILFWNGLNKPTMSFQKKG